MIEYKNFGSKINYILIKYRFIYVCIIRYEEDSFNYYREQQTSVIFACVQKTVVIFR
jgi:hypothetical protein